MGFFSDIFKQLKKEHEDNIDFLTGKSSLKDTEFTKKRINHLQELLKTSPKELSDMPIRRQYISSHDVLIDINKLKFSLSRDDITLEYREKSQKELNNLYSIYTELKNKEEDYLSH